LDSKTVRVPEKPSVYVEDRGLEAWTAAYGSESHLSGTGAARASVGGGAFGVENQVGDFRSGFVLVVGQGDARVRVPDLRVVSDSWAVGGYGSVAVGAVTLDSSVLWGVVDQESIRVDGLGTARARFASNEFHTGIGATVNMAPAGSAWQIAPVARLEFVNLSREAFGEQGGVFPAKFGALSSNRLVSKLGLRIGHQSALSARVDFGIDAGAYWVHDYAGLGGSMPYSVGNSNFTADVPRIGLNSAMFDFGLKATFAEKFTLGLNGRQQVGADQYQTTGVFSLGVKF
jgi:outer membrane autotransporter protein